MGLPRLVGDEPRAGRGRLLAGSRSPAATKASGTRSAVECEGGGEGLCATVRSERCEAEASTIAGGAPDGAIRVLVGPWARLRVGPGRGADRGRARRTAASSPTSTGDGGGDGRWSGLDEAGEAARSFGPGAGLVAATRRYEAPPVWVVTGATRAGGAGGRRPARRRRPARPLRGGDRGRGGDAAAAGVAMRSPFAYTPRPGPLQAASPGRRRRLPRLARRRSPSSTRARSCSSRRAWRRSLAGLLAGARRAVRAALRMGLTLGAPDRRRQRARRQPRRDRAGPARRLAAPRPGRRHRRGDRRRRRPRPARASSAIVAFAVYSACVDPDRVLRALRPDRRPLGADRDPGLAPGPGRRRRRRPPARRRAACAAPAPPRSGGRRSPAASSPARSTAPSTSPRPSSCAATASTLPADREAARGRASRFDRRFYAVARGRARAPRSPASSLGADDFHAYPTIDVGLGPARSPSRPSSSSAAWPRCVAPAKRPALAPRQPRRAQRRGLGHPCLSWRSAAARHPRSRSRA